MSDLNKETLSKKLSDAIVRECEKAMRDINPMNGPPWTVYAVPIADLYNAWRSLNKREIDRIAVYPGAGAEAIGKLILHRINGATDCVSGKNIKAIAELAEAISQSRSYILPEVLEGLMSYASNIADNVRTPGEIKAYAKLITACGKIRWTLPETC